ncbi:hypothetical protein PLICRDRAFT_36214 [Plicaturopsis crispa FD-325 SS-3]|nr:hypothetical protein PLICRDRAFT_36214 [Plicaturopsis crispa FD-325 SS-3]
MAVIWGLDLSAIRFSAFRHKQMFDKKWHLRGERFIIYQAAMLLCVVAESVATYALDKYVDLQNFMHASSGFVAAIYNNDIVAAACVTIVSGVFVATVFGAEFFFLLFWPEYTYPPWVVRWKKIAAVFVTVLLTADVLQWTIIGASHAATISGVDEITRAGLLQRYPKPPLEYHKFPSIVASIVLLWLGWVSTIASTIILFKCAEHDALHGPLQMPVQDIETKAGGASTRESGTPTPLGVDAQPATTKPDL